MLILISLGGGVTPIYAIHYAWDWQVFYPNFCVLTTTQYKISAPFGLNIGILDHMTTPEEPKFKYFPRSICITMVRYRTTLGSHEQLCRRYLFRPFNNESRSKGNYIGNIPWICWSRPIIYVGLWKNIEQGIGS